MTAEWTAPAVERADPDHIAAERRALEQRLDYLRATLLAKCAGLTAEQLTRRAVPPSNLSLLGLVRHVADEERGWFRQCAAGEDVPDLTTLFPGGRSSRSCWSKSGSTASRVSSWVCALPLASSLLWASFCSLKPLWECCR